MDYRGLNKVTPLMSAAVPNIYILTSASMPTSNSLSCDTVLARAMLPKQAHMAETASHQGLTVPPHLATAAVQVHLGTCLTSNELQKEVREKQIQVF